MTPIRALYVHIPFCERKCEYCDFTSTAETGNRRDYISALNREIALLGERAPGVELDTVFVGGGTPSLIEPGSLATVLDAVRAAFRLAPGAEITLEANPSSTTTERAAVWLGAGFNRVSIGVQSLEPDVLTFLGRVHDSARALDAVEEVRAAGFVAVNTDLIYAVPGLDDARWRSTLERIAALAPGHISCYELTVEPGTPLHTSVRRGRVTPVDTDVALRQHGVALDVLEQAGYAHYEVSNFAGAGQECRHNLAYWHNDFYLAAGVGAHGHLPAAVARDVLEVSTGDAVAVRYRHGRGISAYIAAVEGGALPLQDHELVDELAHEQERLMLGLRLRDGVVIADERVLGEAAVLRDAGFLTISDGIVRVTSAGERVLNALTLRLTSVLEPPRTHATI
ncbi:MAG: radical SAM family heme chaperone HemW [Candidatus Dormibacteraeota bacterium]|nr:radical SAM family heme chaperone HemW [Candidatus Dormibacteraeota bacterium]